VGAHDYYPEGGPLLIDDVLAQWWERGCRKLSEAQVYKYERSLCFLSAVHGRLPASQFRRRHLADVQASMAAKGWVAATCNRAVVRVRTFFRWAEAEELVPVGTWHHLLTLEGFGRNDPTVGHSAPRTPLEWMTVEAIFPHVPPVVETMLCVQWWTGMRTGELVSMRRGDVKEEDDCLVYTPRTHKNAWRGQSRVVYLGPNAREAIAPWLAGCAAADDWVFTCKRGRCPATPETPHRKGYTVESFGHAVARGCKAAGVEFAAYDLRHAAADRIRRAAGIQAARCVLGQKHIQTLDGYGSPLDSAHAAEVQKKLG
jgi:integrase